MKVGDIVKYRHGSVYYEVTSVHKSLIKIRHLRTGCYYQTKKQFLINLSKEKGSFDEWV